MSSEVLAGEAVKRPGNPRQAAGRKRRGKSTRSLAAQGEPLIWLSGGAVVVSLAMIVGLLVLVIYQGSRTFWPLPVVQLKLQDGSLCLGEPGGAEHVRLSPGELEALPPPRKAAALESIEQNGGLLARQLVRTGNFDLTGEHFRWVDDYQIVEQSRPEWALVVERLEWGRFYGFPAAFLIDGKEVAADADGVWQQFVEHHAAVRAGWTQRLNYQKREIGAINRAREQALLEVKQQELDHGVDSAEYAEALRLSEEVEAQASEDDARVSGEVARLEAENARYGMRLTTVAGQEKLLPLEEIVRAYPANQLSWFGRLGVYFSRWGEFLTDEPRAANSEGGVFPAIFGTVVMTLIMSLAVAPFGVLAALYLREYAKAGPIVSAVRIAINNLAGVPSIVFGVFGLGFFCYVVGGNIDKLFFPAALAAGKSTFGTGGLLWASLTLALLTLPVVIVTTEEALAAVPGSMREGSYACGASKWQTIQRIVLPRAMPGIMTGMILAMARGAGEVAPLMLVGAMKLAPELPVDSVFPFIHAQRSFMHLGFAIYDMGFQSQNSKAAIPMVFTTTLLLISIVAFLNLAAIWLRSRLRRRFTTNHF